MMSGNNSKKLGAYSSDFSLASSHSSYHTDIEQDTPTSLRPSNKQRSISASFHSSTSASSIDNFGDGRLLFFMNAGERVDRTFPRWLQLNFSDNEDGKDSKHRNYCPNDLNQPISVLQRPNEQHRDDAPLTEIGHATAQLIGRSIRMSKVEPTVVFSSPSLQCVQTALTILQSQKHPLPFSLNLEPGLADYLGGHRQPPIWMDPEKITEECNSLPILLNNDYTPIISTKQLATQYRNETPEHHCRRLRNVVSSALKKCDDATTVLFIGNETLIDAGARGLLRKHKMVTEKEELLALGSRYPASCVVALREGKIQGTWRLANNPLPPITFASFSTLPDFEYMNRN